MSIDPQALYELAAYNQRQQMLREQKKQAEQSGREGVSTQTPAGPKAKEGISGPCVACDNIVSFKAETCLNCGHPNAGEEAKAANAPSGVKFAEPTEETIRNELKKPTGELTKADLEKVTELNLEKNQLTDVKGLEKLTQLKWLGLDNNELTDVKGLENLTQLTELYLFNNKLTSVKGLEKLTQLTVLSLLDNQLTDVKGLAKLKKLNWLDLEYNPDLTKAQIDPLKKALPKCIIASNPAK